LTTNDSPDAPAAGHTGRRLLLAAGVVATVLLAGLLLFAVLARSLLDPAAVADRLEPRLSSTLNRPVEIDGARLLLWPRPALRLSGIRVANRGVFEGTALATVDAVELRPRLLPLLRRRVVVDRLTVRSPRVLLRVTEDGTTNFGDFVPEPEPGEEAPTGDAPLGLELQRIELVDGRAGLDDRRRGRVVRLNGLEATASLARSPSGAIETEGRAAVDTVSARLPGLLAAPLDLEKIRFAWRGSAGPELDSLEIADGTLSLGPLEIRVAGTLARLDRPVRSVDLALAAEGLPLAELAATAGPVASGWRPAGRLGLDLRLRGEIGPDRRPEASGQVTLRGASLGRAGARPLVDAVDVDVRLEADRATIEARGRLGDGTLAAEGAVALDSLLPVDLRVRAGTGLAAIREAAAGRAGPARGLSVEGSASVDARVRGPAGDPSALRMDGDVQVRDVEVATAALAVPLRIAEATVRLDGRDLRWAGLEARLGTSRLRSSGLARDPLGARGRGGPIGIDVELRSPKLDLGEALPTDSGADVGWGRIVSARLGERRVEGRSAEEAAAASGLRRPAAPPLAGEIRVRLDTLSWRGETFSDVSGTVRLAGERIDVPELRFAAWGGRAVMGGSVRLGGEALEPFGLRIELDDVRAERWLARHTPLGDVVRGSLSLGLELAGGLDTLLLPSTVTLAGAGAARLRDGSVAANPFTGSLASFVGLADLSETRIRSWVAPFEIEDGRLVLSDAEAQLGSAEADLSGAVGFDGALDLSMALRPDSATTLSLATSAAAALPEGVRSALGRGVPVELGLRVGGRLTRPEFSLDAAATRAGLQDVVGNVIGRGAERALEEARGKLEESDAGDDDLRRQGLDLLRRLTGGAGGGAVDTAPAPDPIPPDSGQAASPSERGSGS